MHNSELHDRIAAIMWKHRCAQCDHDFDDDQSWFTHLAGALITELGLHPEWGALDDENGGTLADTREELKAWPGETIKRRYITEWTEDE